MNLDKPILIASGNVHKIDEIAAVFKPAGLNVVGLNSLDLNLPEPEEDQPTFEGNARLKARYYAEKTGMLCLADDSGLEVDALSGLPGVYSARFAGASGAKSDIDKANSAKLVDQLSGVSDENRTARFVCVMVLAGPGRIWAQVRGTVEGHIIESPRGNNGFGYDPHFLIPRLNQTTAELSPAEKNQISHRGNACRLMTEALASLIL